MFFKVRMTVQLVPAMQLGTIVDLDRDVTTNFWTVHVIF